MLLCVVFICVSKLQTLFPLQKDELSQAGVGMYIVVSVIFKYSASLFGPFHM